MSPLTFSLSEAFCETSVPFFSKLPKCLRQLSLRTNAIKRKKAQTLASVIMSAKGLTQRNMPCTYQTCAASKSTQTEKQTGGCQEWEVGGGKAA